MSTPGRPPTEIGRLRLQWLVGDWEALSEIRKDDDLPSRDDRAERAQLAIAGCLQSDLYDEAEALIRQAMSWGSTRAEMARLMVACTFNSLGRASAAIGDFERSMAQFRLSISTPIGGLDNLELARARATYQKVLMNAHGTTVPAAADTDNPPSFAKPDTGITSYAQNFEDVILWRALGRIDGGFYIDIGAQDPIVDSVSRAFYEKGWRGIHVEPTATYAEKLRLDRPDEEVVQAAVSIPGGEITFFEIPATGLSTGSPEIAASHLARGFEVREVQVPCVSLAEIFERAGQRPVHWLKIDVEGMEDPVLKSWGESEARPWVVVVESTVPLSQVESFQEWECQLIDRNYRFVYFDGLNRFYVSHLHRELQAAFSSGPNVFDGFVLSGKSTASFSSRSGS